MNHTLATIAACTVDRLENVSSSFDDLPTPVYVRRRGKGQSRIIDATAAERSTEAKARAVARGPQSGNYDPSHQNNPATGDIIPDVPGNPNPASEAQLHYIGVTLEWLAEVDADGAAAMTGWLDRGGRDTLTGGRDGSASALITRIKERITTKKVEARALASAGPRRINNNDGDFQDIPNGYYAVADAGPDDIHYFRISRFRDGGIKVQERASDTLHPVRRGGRRTAILTTIQTVGWRESMELYGQTIGSCGRCHRTLTDALSRSRGIGPDCWGKM